MLPVPLRLAGSLSRRWIACTSYKLRPILSHTNFQLFPFVSFTPSRPYTMEVDPVEVPPEAAGPSPKRPQENEENPDAPVKRPKYASENPDEVPEPAPGGADKREGKRKQNTGGPKKSKEKKDYVRVRRGTRADGEEAPDNGEPKAPRLPKRQCALLIGFCGAGYSGMQIQPHPNSRTIEGVLFDALVKVGAVSQDNADNPVKVSLGRAARTDAGVHAAGNVVSMKVINVIPGVPNLVARINEELPPEIRLWSILRVQNSFNARTTCDSRKYSYYFPSYLMVPPKPGSGVYQTLIEHGADTTPHPFWATAEAESTAEDDLRRKRDYRVTVELMASLRETVEKFLGTHNFHNYTVGRGFSDRSCQRHMKSIQIADPVVHGDTEWIEVMFHGQSFMLHQRKMMSALVLACRTGTPPHIIEELYGPRMAFIPKMPALGLLLEYPIFESYSRKVTAANEGKESTHPDYRREIDFEVHREAIDKFKQEHIYSRMRATEGQGGVFDAWVRSIDAYSGNDLLYLNPKGVIPAAAVIKKGERRNNPFKEKRRFDATTFPAGGEGAADVESQEEEEESEGALNKTQLADMEG